MPIILNAAIYTSDIESAPDRLDIGAVTAQARQIFLGKLEGGEWLQSIIAKIQEGKSLSKGDIVKLELIAFTATKSRPLQRLEDCVDTARMVVKNPASRVNAIARLLAAGSKLIGKAFIDKAMERLKTGDLERAPFRAWPAFCWEFPILKRPTMARRHERLVILFSSSGAKSPRPPFRVFTLKKNIKVLTN